MKKTFYVLSLALALTATATSTFATYNKPAKVEITEAEKTELSAISKRVAEIKMIDRSSLTKVEKKALRAEVRELKRRSDFLSQNVSLSLGAIIIILLLLIIIF